MAKISKKPITDISEDVNVLQFILEEMEDVLTQPGVGSVNHIPAIDIFSTHEEIVIEVEVPGVRKEDIEIALKESTLIIKGLKYDCFDDKKVHYICMERAFGKLFRSIDIPCSVDSRQIKATCHNGLLVIKVARISDRRGESKKIRVE